MTHSNFRRYVPLFLTVGFVLIGLVFVNQANAGVTCADKVTYNQVDLPAASPITLTEGVDTNAITKVLSVVRYPITTTIDLSENSQIAADGTITYGDSEVAGNVTFALVCGASNGTSTVSMIVPAHVAPAPTVDIGSPSLAIASSTNSVDYTITYGDATEVTLEEGDVTLNTTGTADGTVAVSGTGTSTRIVNISGLSGDGTLGISIDPGTAVNGATPAPAAGPSTTFAVDTIPPTVDAYPFEGHLLMIGLPTFVNTSSATSSDDGSGIDSYLWTQVYATGTNVTITFDDATVLDTIINVTEPGSYIARLTVTDNVGNSAYDDFDFEAVSSFPSLIDGAPYWGLNPFDFPALFSIDNGTSSTSTTQITSKFPIVATTTSSHGTAEILLPPGLTITKSDDSEFDATFIGAHDSSGQITALDIGNNLILRGTTGFGTPGMTFYFSAPITIKIPVAVANGTVLQIRRNSAPNTPWTTDGLTASPADVCLNGIGNHPVSTAVVTGGYVTIYTCQASAFVTYSGGPPPASGMGSTGSTTTTPTISDLQQQIATLISQLKSLILQAQAKGLTISAAAQSLIGTTSSFTRDLKFGMTGDDVKGLQIYLNSKGFIVSSTGDGSLNHETTYFGNATRAALIKFQKASGISPASGYFGPLTRAYVNSHP